jgi:predicted permease
MPDAIPVRLSAGLAVLLNVAAGVVVGVLKVLPKSSYTILNGFVFKVALPALVCRGIGIKTDLYEGNIWRFIGAFLILRAISLVVAGVTNISARYDASSIAAQYCPPPHTSCVDTAVCSFVPERY